MFKKINQRLSEIEEVLTRPAKKQGDKKYIGGELDEKVEVTDFEKFKTDVIGKRKCDMYSFYITSWIDTNGNIKSNEAKSKTLFEEIDELKESIKKIEEYLGIVREQKELKIDKYVKGKKNTK